MLVWYFWPYRYGQPNRPFANDGDEPMNADRAFARTWTGTLTGTWTWLRPTRLAALTLLGVVAGMVLGSAGI